LSIKNKNKDNHWPVN
jgi:hypothetical protein